MKSWSDKNDRISEPFVSPDSKEYDLICLSCVLSQQCVFLLLPYDRPYHKSDSEYHWFSVQCSIPALLKHNCGDLVSAFCNNPWIFFKDFLSLLYSYVPPWSWVFTSNTHCCSFSILYVWIFLLIHTMVQICTKYNRICKLLHMCIHIIWCIFFRCSKEAWKIQEVFQWDKETDKWLSQS